MLSVLPADRVVNIVKGMTKQEVESKYLLAFMDRDYEKISSSQDLADLKEKRANLKVLYRQSKNEGEKNRLQKEIDNVGYEISTI